MSNILRLKMRRIEYEKPIVRQIILKGFRGPYAEDPSYIIISRVCFPFTDIIIDGRAEVSGLYHLLLSLTLCVTRKSPFPSLFSLCEMVFSSSTSNVCFWITRYNFKSSMFCSSTSGKNKVLILPKNSLTKPRNPISFQMLISYWLL